MLRFEVPEPNKKINFQLELKNRRKLRRIQDGVETKEGVAPSLAFILNVIADEADADRIVGIITRMK